MTRKSQDEIYLENRLAELYETLAVSRGGTTAKLGARGKVIRGSSESIELKIEQVKFELSRFDARRDARRVSTREWANFALTVLSVAAAILIAIFKKGS